jgi:hypothetical protein
MKLKPFLTLLLIIILTGLACNLPTSAGRSAEQPTDSLPSDLATLSPQTNTDISGLAGAALTLQDLPEGYQQLSDEDLADFGFAREKFTGNFKGMLSKAETQNFTAFIKSGPSGYEIILSTVLAPLSAVERIALDLYLSNPEQFAQDFAQDAESREVEVLAGSDAVGEKSAGITFLTQANGRDLRSDTVISRRGEAIQAAIVLYPDGSQPETAAADVAQIVDQKISAALR